MFKRITHNKRLIAYIVGVALGDGNLSNPNGRATRLRVTCDIRYKKLYLHIKKSIQQVFPDNKVSIYRNETYLNISCYSNRLEKILGWKAGNGTKFDQKVKIPEWILKDKFYIRECLRGLVQTDGSIYKDRKYQMVNIISSIPSLADSIVIAINKIDYKPNVQLHKDPETIKYTIRVSKDAQKFIRDLNLWKK